MAKKNNWNRFHTIEGFSLLLLVLIIIIGIAFEITAQRGHAKWIIEDLRDVALVILQIQAGISTLAVALLALISGMIGDEAYGESVIRFYLRIRPKVFKKQKHISGIKKRSLMFV